MKDRIFKIMKQENLNQKDFAATTGISPATLSSIFNGRTSPTLNHAECLHRRFPKLNMSWLLFGEGDMYVKEENEETDATGGGHSGGTSALSQVGSSDGIIDERLLSSHSDAEGGTPRMPVIREVVKYVDKPQRKITEIRIFFDDGTFENFSGR